jgi:hypothetical protein
MKGTGGMQSLAPAPLAAPLPRQSGAEAFWNSFGCDHADRSASVSSSFPSPDAGRGPRRSGGRSLVTACHLIPSPRRGMVRVMIDNKSFRPLNLTTF